jgi:hypothetical protein
MDTIIKEHFLLLLINTTLDSFCISLLRLSFHQNMFAMLLPASSSLWRSLSPKQYFAHFQLVQFGVTPLWSVCSPPKLCLQFSQFETPWPAINDVATVFLLFFGPFHINEVARLGP